MRTVAGRRRRGARPRRRAGEAAAAERTEPLAPFSKLPAAVQDDVRRVLPSEYRDAPETIPEDVLEATIEASTPALVAAGLLVGFGTRLGSGCTSGHGVCGISRGSVRSIVATVTFMAVAALTVFVTRHVAGGAA